MFEDLGLGNSVDGDDVELIAAVDKRQELFVRFRPFRLPFTWARDFDAPSERAAIPADAARNAGRSSARFRSTSRRDLTERGGRPFARDPPAVRGFRR